MEQQQQMDAINSNACEWINIENNLMEKKKKKEEDVRRTVL